MDFFKDNFVYRKPQLVVSVISWILWNIKTVSPFYVSVLFYFSTYQYSASICFSYRNQAHLLCSAKQMMVSICKANTAEYWKTLKYIAKLTRNGLRYNVKIVLIRCFSSPYFPVFGLNTEWYGVSPVFSPNAGKYGPKKLQICTFFT